MVEQILDVQKDIWLKLEKSNAKYTAAADKKRREKLFCEGDMVMVYLQRERIFAGAYKKLKPKKYETFKIVKKNSDNTYVVGLSKDMAMSKTFNVTDLYACHPAKQLYPEYNSRASSFKEGETDVRDRGNWGSRYSSRYNSRYILIDWP